MKNKYSFQEIDNEIRDSFLRITQVFDERNKLRDNWNSLKEYTEAHIEVCENRLSTPFCNFEKATKELMIHQNYLDKMNELEGKDNNGIMDKKSR